MFILIGPTSSCVVCTPQHGCGAVISSSSFQEGLFSLDFHFCRTAGRASFWRNEGVEKKNALLSIFSPKRPKSNLVSHGLTTPRTDNTTRCGRPSRVTAALAARWSGARTSTRTHWPPTLATTAALQIGILHELRARVRGDAERTVAEIRGVHWSSVCCIPSTAHAGPQA
jgi:hypothetical protein